MSYTLSKAEDNSTDFQSAFIPQNNGAGRDDARSERACRSDSTRTRKGPSLQDQRHRFVVSGLYILPYDVQLSSIVTIGSGRPYNILAGADLNGDGDGGAFPSDRARTTPADLGIEPVAQRGDDAGAGDRGSARGAAVPGRDG